LQPERCSALGRKQARVAPMSTHDFACKVSPNPPPSESTGSANARLFTDAIQAGRPGTQNPCLTGRRPCRWNVSGDPVPAQPFSGRVSAEGKAQAVDINRGIGLHRILFGTDMPLAGNPTPRDGWRLTILTLPLPDDEVRDIADDPRLMPGADCGASPDATARATCYNHFGPLRGSS
jgi:hypothetical protein